MTPTYELARYPDYLFSHDGTPTRKVPTKRGPHAGQVLVASYTTGSQERYYKLTDILGKRTSVSQRSLANALASQDRLQDLVPLRGYNSYYADRSGFPYRLQSSGALHKLNSDPYVPNLRYVLYDNAGRRRALSPASIKSIAQL